MNHYDRINLPQKLFICNLIYHFMNQFLISHFPASQFISSAAPVPFSSSICPAISCIFPMQYELFIISISFKSSKNTFQRAAGVLYFLHTLNLRGCRVTAPVGVGALTRAFSYLATEMTFNSAMLPVFSAVRSSVNIWNRSTLLRFRSHALNRFKF